MLPLDETESNLDEDPVIRMIPTLIEKIVLPQIDHTDHTGLRHTADRPMAELAIESVSAESLHVDRRNQQGLGDRIYHAADVIDCGIVRHTKHDLVHRSAAALLNQPSGNHVALNYLKPLPPGGC